MTRDELASKIANTMIDMLVPGLFVVHVNVSDHAATVMLQSAANFDQWEQEICPLSDFGKTEDSFKSECKWALESLVGDYAVEYFIKKRA